MKVAVINFSGNVGKSVVAKNLLLPRIPNAAFVAVETINRDEDVGEKIKGSQFVSLHKELILADDVVVDVGSSNVEVFISLMSENEGSHEEFDLFVVPTVSDKKQVQDTIGTIEALSALGVEKENIRLIFNRVNITDDLEETFYQLFAYHKDANNFTLSTRATIRLNEVYQELRQYNTDIETILSKSKQEYKAELREALKEGDRAAVERARDFVSIFGLAKSARQNLDEVFEVITEGLCNE